MQKHNEQKLREAFEQSKDVFLIFSVNSSGHFQGYARMVSIGQGQVFNGPNARCTYVAAIMQTFGYIIHSRDLTTLSSCALALHSACVSEMSK